MLLRHAPAARTARAAVTEGADGVRMAARDILEPNARDVSGATLPVVCFDANGPPKRPERTALGRPLTRKEIS